MGPLTLDSIRFQCHYLSTWMLGDSLRCFEFSLSLKYKCYIKEGKACEENNKIGIEEEKRKEKNPPVNIQRHHQSSLPECPH